MEKEGKPRPKKSVNTPNASFNNIFSVYKVEEGSSIVEVLGFPFFSILPPSLAYPASYLTTLSLVMIGALMTS